MKAYLYTEDRTCGNRYREEQYRQLVDFIKEARKSATIKRENHIQYDFHSENAFLKSQEKYRTEFFRMLGWPLTEYSSELAVPDTDIAYIHEDSLGRIFRLSIRVMPGITTYGLLFLPNTTQPYPLVISQHGGGGTPELCSGFFGPSNYNDMTRRILRKGYAVFAPQLYLWDKEFGPQINRTQIDNQLKQIGGSITALELYKLMRSIDYLHSRQDIDRSKTGMIGLSYGGFYTLFTAAADFRIKAAISSCFFNDRYMYDWPDWTWFDSGNLFFDAEICSLICPRSLCIEVAEHDEIFDIAGSRREISKVVDYYRKLGCIERLKFIEFEGVHELNKGDAGIEYFSQQLMSC